MYNWVTTRKIARTEAENTPPRVAQTVDAIVAKWIPVTAALLACAMTPARPDLDVRQYEWQPAFTWVRPVVDATVRTYIPAATTELQSYCVIARPDLDVRQYEWAPEFIDAVSRVDAKVRTWIPAFDAELASQRTDGRRLLDICSSDWIGEESGWIQATLTPPPTVAQRWPAIQQQGARTIDGRRLDVRSYEWTTDEASWIAATQIAAPSIAQTAPAFTSQASSFRTVTSSVLDVRSSEWGQPAWIFAALPVQLTDAQKWPAILEATGLSYRTPARPSLDVRSYEWTPSFSWVQPVIDASIARWSPIFRAELASVRTGDDPRLDVRGFAWAPDAAGWMLASFAPPATTAQTWPALLQNLGTQYQTPLRAPLDVRRYDWQPSFTWSAKVVDGTVAKWAPIFRAQESPRTAQRALFDVRPSTDSPQLALLFIAGGGVTVFGGADLVILDALITQLSASDALVLVTTVSASDAAVTQLDVADILLVTP